MCATVGIGWSRKSCADLDVVRVLYFGTYERDYPRNAQVISCLRGAGVEVMEKHVPIWEEEPNKLSPRMRTLLRVAAAELRLALGRAGDAELLIVGYPGHLDMPSAKRAARGRPVVFNPLVSLADTMIEDRRLVEPRSPGALALSLVDRTAFRHADLVVADTASHRDYFIERFDLAADRVAVCYVGAEDRLFSPGCRPPGQFEVLFVGTLIPLHGVETILAAAALCRDIRFRMVGSGQMAHLLAKRPDNVIWERWSSYESLPHLYRSAGCALGVFGLSEKAARVIPNKAFHALATETPLITADTPAARELLEHERDALLVQPGDAEELAGAVRRLDEDSRLRSEIGTRGRSTYLAHASEEALGKKWRTMLEDLLRGTPGSGQ